MSWAEDMGHDLGWDPYDEEYFGEEVTPHSDVIFVKLKHETPKAWLLSFSDMADEWFPKSLCEVAESGEDGSGVLNAPDWLLMEKGRL